MAVNLVAAIWGFAEATLFFLVPDIWFSVQGRKNLHRGLLACVYGLVGALLGGVVIYLWSGADPDGAAKLISRVPAIGPTMFEQVGESLKSDGIGALLMGPFLGIPYKVYAAQASTAGIGLGAFFLASIPARLLRFVCITAVVHYTAHYCKRRGWVAEPLPFILCAWLVFYVFYFSVFAE